ncbi:NADP-dependent oxidoreductase [Anabaena cylindrica FACHB-243]|uniref:2-alkenal reductase n=1 Tax=Anabaena cylindrica (strain ATCC 27899 / PCC 7122) TaxID=272123 RepID=K9ZQB3_ANACC|nr:MULTISPECIES: NADP-dependent oxidoreductase [Anabaena]AFZ60712.1 2-alkenal reductase [Anabaena cylindrica PCC 7122]MBD2418371.1 NADP-dependent oxidoreductase [Anabaena cylindrica FACHB-243]MBY5280836.1 NADP-dependent oxidoreductase [Anabaena sp. CCAP 1446/1C]MBY5311033.1 NADP-dependent oxidoreductase [Anabaena sp. CCAP 1446/1C]MCM2408699.1 NADP-dependent oxidoreductase [Anabaena sp. CCAP 1446/1C]
MQKLINRQWRLASRPVGEIKESDFEYREEPIPSPKDGEILVRNIYLSLDPTHRIWMSDRPQYMPPIGIGEVMRGLVIGVVEDSKNLKFQPGDLVSGALGWQNYAIASSGNLIKLPQPLAVPLTAFMGPLSFIGCTAYFGLLDIGKPQAGETVVVSAASGAVGSLVGQIAKIKGCRVVGITGSEEKCQWLLEELGFDAAINYKTADLIPALAKFCPHGIDVYFENVGGAILDAVLTQVNLNARIPLCGLISTYNAEEAVPGPYNFSQILMKRVLVQGFIVNDYVSQWDVAFRDIGQWLQEGKIKYTQEIVPGLENAPQAILKLFDGRKMGKLIIQISDEP